MYISEAHAADDARPVGYAEELGIQEHTSTSERCTVAESLMKDKKLTVPCLIDGMDNKVAEAYQSHPDRLYVVRKDGRLAVAGDRGPRGFAPALKASQAWLAEYQKTGVEPEVEKYADLSPFGASPDRARRPSRRLGVRLDGLRVIDVVAGSVAEKSGLQVDDLIAKVGGTTLNGADDLARELRGGEPKKVLTLRRGEKQIEIRVAWPEESDDD